MRKEGRTAITATPGGIFVFSPLAREAYQKILNLRFAEARADLDNLKRREPDNLIGLFMENYLDVLTVVVDDSPAEYRRLIQQMNARLGKIARGDKYSPYYLYVQAEIRLQWAVLRSRYGDYLAAFDEGRKAYNLLSENQRRYPGFVANQKSLGILHALVGNVPDEYRWGLKLLGGMGGTVEQGLRELESVLAHARQHDFVFETETRVAYAFLLLHLKNDKNAAWQALATGKVDPKTNPLAAFARASLAIRTGRNDEAIRLLKDCPAGGPYYPFPYRDYLLGMAKLNRLDPDANEPLEVFVRTFAGESGVKEAYQKLAWFHLLQGNEKGYHRYMNLVRTQGADRAEPDKAALREANSGEMPDARLTRARLLFDGAYYQRAYELLKNAAGAYSNAGKSGLEYAYRMGRIAHELGQTQEASRYYALTIDTGAQKPWYFACNAALQLGLLFEQHREYAQARSAFERCLGIHPEEYAGSLHARAKAGLARVRDRH